MELNPYTKKLNKVIYSVAALCLLVLLLFTATYAWLSKTMTATTSAEDEYITIDADAGLEMNYGNEGMNEGIININNVIKDGFALYECSSADGRNIFFPLSQYSKYDTEADGKFNDDADTKDFLFRPATVNDKNTKYISVDLTLKAKEDVPVYLRYPTDENGNKLPMIQGDCADAIRIAFIENEPNGKAVIFDNSIQGYGEQYDAISQITTTNKKDIYGNIINEEGSVNSPLTVTCNSIGAYTFGRNALFELQGGVEKKITVNIWLEGTDAQCTYQKLANIKNYLDIHIKFTTTGEDLKPYYFVDHTLEKWVDDDDCYVFAFDQDGNEHPMEMSETYETDHTWVVNMPESVIPVEFARYNPDEQGEWNIWEAGNPGVCTTYNAFAHNTGIWNDSFQGDTITFFDGTSDHQVLEQRDDTEMLVSYTIQDGNGNDVDFTHKMSYQYNNNNTPDDYSDDIDYKKWCIVIPSDASNITFSWYDTTVSESRVVWEAFNRGNNTYFTSTDTFAAIGYWSDRVLLIDSSEGGYADIEEGVIWVAYFFDGNTEIGWTAMNATTKAGRYMAGIPEGATQVIFCRYADGSGYFDWECVYNQTNDLTFGTNNLFKVNGYDGNNRVNGTWSKTTNID